MNRMDDATQLLSRYPTSALLLEFASSIFTPSELRLLPSPTVLPEIVAARIVEVAEHAGREILSLTGRADRSDCMRTPFIASHRSFFDLACVELSRTSTVRASLMGPTFLLPDDVFAERNRRKNGKSFAYELKLGADRFNIMRVIVRNDVNRFRSSYLPYIKEGSERSIVSTMLESAAKMRRGEFLTRLEFRCVDIGFANPPHLFDEVALIGSRSRPDASVDGGWLIHDKNSIATEVDKFDRVFLSYERGQSWDKLEAFLTGLL